VQAMNLEGSAMVAFRRDRQGRPVLMEVNPRLRDSLALASAAGVNFPEMLYNWQIGGGWKSAALTVAASGCAG